MSIMVISTVMDMTISMADSPATYCHENASYCGKDFKMRRFAILFFIPFLFLSLTACNSKDDDSDDLIFMWFDVEGKVVNEAGEPIPGISIYAESADVVTTDEYGKFSVRGGGSPAETTTIRCMDTDKEENGRYMTKITVVELVKYKDGQGWTEGYYRNREDIVIVMTADPAVTPVDPAS